ncbi:MAG: GNAT family N-acetyltransferase [Clostridia bacterium]|nr:GNAT family N-acetyltransferase [Clostridia bacterium]
MKNFDVKPVCRGDFDYYYKLLAQDFCECERKKYDDELRSLDNPLFSPCFITADGDTVGYISFWRLGGFTFIEHFAILKSKRSQAIGSEFLSFFLSTNPMLTVLEVERPTDEISARRIAFYERMGFAVNKFDYVQPSYHRGADAVPMYICSYDRALSYDEYAECIAKIKDAVYP